MYGGHVTLYKTVSGGEFGWGSHLSKDNAGVLRLAQ